MAYHPGDILRKVFFNLLQLFVQVICNLNIVGTRLGHYSNSHSRHAISSHQSPVIFRIELRKSDILKTNYLISIFFYY